MIECTNEYIYKKKKRRFSKFLSILFFLTVIVGVWAYNRFVVFNLVVSYLSTSLDSYSSYAVNTALYENYQNIGEYNDIVRVEKNELGDIVLLDINSFEINKITREIIDKSTLIMSDKMNEGIEVPVLAFTGISFISGYGHKINFKSLSVSKIIGEYRSDFKSSGINQTLHCVYIDFICQIDVFFPLSRKSVEVVVPVLICQSILVGKVPDVYLNGKLFS